MNPIVGATDMMILEDTFRYGGARSISSSKDNIDKVSRLSNSKMTAQSQLRNSLNNFENQNSKRNKGHGCSVRGNYASLNRINSKYNNLTLSRNMLVANASHSSSLAVNNYRTLNSETKLAKTQRMGHGLSTSMNKLSEVDVF